MKKTVNILLMTIMVTVLASCDWLQWATSGDSSELGFEIQRFDRLQSRYLTTGDFSALQQMNTNYPMEMRTLIENMLQLGAVDQVDINDRLLKFYQDSTLQKIIVDAERQYADMEDINDDLARSFKNLQRQVPQMEMPLVYTQIGALAQSIVVGDNTIGISLDKYLGKDYPIYKRYYTAAQMEQMSREYIVPDCLVFYILSKFPLVDFEHRKQEERDTHIGRVMWVVNKAMGREFFKTNDVKRAGEYLASHGDISITEFLSDNKK